MRVRIKGVWYDAESTPILIQVNENDRQNLKEMPLEHINYVCFPEHQDFEEALEELGMTINGEGKLEDK